MDGCRHVFSHTLERIHSGVRNNLAKLDMDDNLFDEVFEDVVDPFTGLETKYLQEKYIAEKFNYVVSLLYVCQ